MPSLLRPLVLLHLLPGAPATSGSWLRRRLANQCSDEFRNSLVSCWITPSHFCFTKVAVATLSSARHFCRKQTGQPTEELAPAFTQTRHGEASNNVSCKPVPRSQETKHLPWKLKYFRHGKSCLSNLRGKGSGNILNRDKDKPDAS